MISIIIPAYNAEATIAATIESVIQQTCADWELIVCDDGSTDKTAGIVEGFADKRIQLHRFENSALPAVARNRGIALAGGEFIAFLDADDLWRPEKLDQQLAFLQKHGGCGLVFTQFQLIDAGGVSLSCNPLPKMPAGSNPARLLDRLAANSFICNSSVLMKAQVVGEIGPLNESPLHRGSEDFEFWLRVAREHPIGWVAEVLVDYRVHASGISRNQTVMNRGGFLAVQRQLENVEASDRTALKTARCEWAFKWRLAETLAGDREGLRRAIEETAACDFSPVRKLILTMARLFPGPLNRLISLRRRLRHEVA